MRLIYFALFAGIFYSTSFVAPISFDGASKLYHCLDFAMVSDKPGAALVFRLKKNQMSEKILVCFREACYHAAPQWQILATDPDVPGNQVLTLTDDRGRWAFRKIHLEGNLWEQAHKKIVQLRLPASVVKHLEEQAGQIAVNQAEDAKLFATSIQEPWSTQWILPIRSKVTSEFGSARVPPHGNPYFHTGVDLRAQRGTAVHVSSDGIVVGTGEEVIYGNVITVDHGSGLMTRYMHLSSFNVNVGDRVKTGDVIGLSGATGRAEAPHLHWEMRIRGQPVDPLSTRLLLARLSDLE